MKSKFKDVLLRFNTLRRVIQLVFFIFFSTMIFNIGALPLLFPVLWTWGFELNAVGDAFTALQIMLYNLIIPWLALTSFLITGILLGKALCGWVCPFGFIQDLIGVAKSKKKELSIRTHETMIYLKYAILGITLFVSITFSITKLIGIHSNYERALGVFVKAPFTTLSPGETLFAVLPQMVQDFVKTAFETPILDVLSGIANLPPLFWAQISIMVVILVLSAYIPRFWCRYFCPHAAVMAMMNKLSFIGLRRDPVKCTKGACRRCVEVCPMKVRLLDLAWEKISDPECIYCMKCVDACPDNAIAIKYP